MELTFYKYHGAGNDFILFKNWGTSPVQFDQKQIKSWCHRNYGIGADGFISIEKSPTSDFYMNYYNADGLPSTMCGNGGRCAVAFAHRSGLIGDDTIFEAADGLHHAKLTTHGTVVLGMIDVADVAAHDSHCFLDTGSPHHVAFADQIDALDVYSMGKTIRNDAQYVPEGTNVNFVQQLTSNTFKIRTYERGVENETLACGTGAVAAALAAYRLGLTHQHEVEIQAVGGMLTVSFEPGSTGFKNIKLEGPAVFVCQILLSQ